MWNQGSIAVKEISLVLRCHIAPGLVDSLGDDQEGCGMDFHLLLEMRVKLMAENCCCHARELVSNIFRYYPVSSLHQGTLALALTPANSIAWA